MTLVISIVISGLITCASLGASLYQIVNMWCKNFCLCTTLCYIDILWGEPCKEAYGKAKHEVASPRGRTSSARAKSSFSTLLRTGAGMTHPLRPRYLKHSIYSIPGGKVSSQPRDSSRGHKNYLSPKPPDLTRSEYEKEIDKFLFGAMIKEKYCAHEGISMLKCVVHLAIHRYSSY